MIDRFLYKISAVISVPLCAVLFLVSCNSNQPKPQVATAPAKINSLPIKYAHGFAVDYYNGFKVISINDGRDSTKVIARYVLSANDSLPDGFKDATLVHTPIERVICVSTTHMAEMKRLNLLDRLAGVTNINLIYDEEIGKRIQAGSISNLGAEELNYEKLVALNPSFVFTSGSYDGGDKMKTKLQSLHITQVLNFDYMEQDPLGRAEWLKFMGALFDRENEADSIFKSTETNYISLREKVKDEVVKPTVFCNLPFKEIWYMPCGENYMARLFADAGGNFLWKDAAATNGLNLNLDYEAVYDKAANADYWINTGFALSMKEIKDADRKNAFFKAYKTGQVYNNNLRNTPAGGFDFWESGVVYPDKILADLIRILHPDKLPDHQLYYYQKLK